MDASRPSHSTHSSREFPFSISLTEAMDDAPEPSPRQISFSDKTIPRTFNGHSKRQSLYASQDPISSVPPSPSLYSARYSSLSPEMAERPRTMSPMGAPENFRNPFGYQTQIYAAGKPSLKSSSEIGKRRGHRYKHSSVSHQIFQEPIQRAPLRLPASLPVPTTKEGWKSMSKEQTIRLGWCFCHLIVAGYVQWNAHGSLAVTALSHLVFYDAIGAFLCAGVEVLGNFEVWKRSTIRQPFGLERSELLISFALAILLLFMGFDLLSHSAKHALEHSGSHLPHTPHDHARASAITLDSICLVTMATTLTSAFLVRTHARLTTQSLRGRNTSSSGEKSWNILPTVLRNPSPSHLFTLSCSAALLLMPFFEERWYSLYDKALSGIMALSMCFLGAKLVMSLGSMLLMSYSGSGNVGEVLREIEDMDVVKRVEEAKFWQVHYGLGMANLRVRVKGGEEGLMRAREKIGAVIRGRLGGGEGGGMGWEVSTQLVVEAE